MFVGNFHISNRLLKFDIQMPSSLCKKRLLQTVIKDILNSVVMSTVNLYETNLSNRMKRFDGDGVSL